MTASIEAPFPKSMEINFSVNISNSYRFDAYKLIAFHTNYSGAVHMDSDLV